jgi:D-2-hydroxyacid dehydrogenase (NADP+)
MRIVVSIHEPPVWSIPASQVDRIARARPGDTVIDARDADARLREFPSADALFTWRISAAEFALAPRVRWMHSSAVGVDTLLPAPVVASPVVVTMSRGVHSESIAEHAIALVLALRRHLHVAARRQHERAWAQVEIAAAGVPALAATRLLVIGLGSIGARIASHAAALGMQVRGVRRRSSLKAPDGVVEVFAADELSAALPDADVVVLAAPRTGETGALIGRAELARMKPGALLINVARGQLVDEPALAEALGSGRLGGAGLDAFAREPLSPESPLWAFPNVLITPHTASFSGDYWTPVVDLFLENVGRFERGEPLHNVVDKTRGY